MEAKKLEKIKEELEKQKASLEEQLSKFAKKDIKPKGDWDTKFPDINEKVMREALEDKAKRVEEYEKMLPVEFALERRLKNINDALGKIKKGKYGICEKCHQEISEERLLAAPEARTCLNCQKE